MSKLAIEYLRHVLDEIKFIKETITPLGEDGLSRNEGLKRATVRSLEIIGEAIKQVPDDVRKEYPDIDWKSYAGLRDKLIHHYFGINYRIVWDVIKNELPDLKSKIEHIVQKESTM